MSSVTRWLQGNARQGGGEAKAQAAACRCCRQPVGRIPAAAIPPPPRVERHHEAQRSARGAEDHPEPAAAAPTTSSACVLCASAPPHRPVDPARSGAAHGLAPCHVQYQLKIIEYALLSMVCVHSSAFESCGTISKEKTRGESESRTEQNTERARPDEGRARRPPAQAWRFMLRTISSCYTLCYVPCEDRRKRPADASHAHVSGIYTVGKTPTHTHRRHTHSTQPAWTDRESPA